MDNSFQLWERINYKEKFNFWRENVDYRALGRRVRQQRVLNEMTQEELAEKAGISCSFVGHIERGEKKASVETLVCLCNALGVSPNILLQDSLEHTSFDGCLEYGEENSALVNDIMQVLREHKKSDVKYR